MMEHSKAWVQYSYLQFGIGLIMALFGIFKMEMGSWFQGYMAMTLVFMIGSTVNLTKILRDNHESESTVYRMEQAKTAKLLRELDEAA
ncbi:MAG: YiaA/YiaB family inner membrane protein [Pseudomonadota bacterium]